MSTSSFPSFLLFISLTNSPTVPDVSFWLIAYLSFVVNGIVLKLAFSIVPGAHISGFFNAILAAILLTIANTIFYNVFD